MAADGMLSLSWNNHKATFCHILSTLREKERYTDVTIACEGKFYPVHKLVLSTCSEYFEKMFEHTPCKHPVIVLKDIKPDELEALLSYMYAGVVSVLQQDLARLIKAAELLQIKGLAVPDEPPMKEPGKKNVHSWSSRDDRSSPHPKRRRREEPMPIVHQQSKQVVDSPPSSPHHQDLNHSWEQNKSQNHNQSREEEPRINEQADQNSDFSSTKQEVQQSQEGGEETLVKEEVVDTEGNPRESSEPGLEYSSIDGGGGGDEQSNKFSHHLDPKHPQPLHEAVVEALAGPSGMQGWLGTGEIGGGFGMLESYSEEGSQEVHGAAAATTTTQQAHQMVELNCEGLKSSGRSVSKVHLCPFCKYTTLKKDHMTKHVRIHTGEKPFSCSYCSYSATTKQKVMQHIRVHTGERPFSCPHCSYSATKKDKLRQHIRTHTGEKLFTCPHCAFRCSSAGTLISHIQTHSS